MRILDNDNDKSLKNIILYLTFDEAIEIIGALENLIKNKDKNEHFHINDLEYIRELTITLYNAKDLSHFNERSKKLINDEN